MRSVFFLLCLLFAATAHAQLPLPSRGHMGYSNTAALGAIPVGNGTAFQEQFPTHNCALMENDSGQLVCAEGGSATTLPTDCDNNDGAKYDHADATWVCWDTSLLGNTFGAAGSTDGHVVKFEGTSGKNLADSGLTLTGTNTGDETGSSVLTKIKTVDGSGSGLDADLLDGHDQTYFLAGGGGGTGDVIGPVGATNNDVAFFDGATGRLIKDMSTTLTGTNTGDETGSTVLTKIKTVDGSGSGLDADTLDGLDSTDFAAAATAGNVNGPGSSHNNTVVFWDGTTGKLLKDNNTSLSGSNTGDETASGILTKIETVDGTGSGLDCDMLDSHDTAYFLPGGGGGTGDVFHQPNTYAARVVPRYYDTTGTEIYPSPVSIADDGTISGAHVPAGLVDSGTLNVARVGSSSGNADTVLRGDGSFGAAPAASVADGSVTLPKLDSSASGATPADLQTFTSSGTWTKPANARTVKIIATGAGGGGGGGGGQTGGEADGGGGGGGGAHCEATFAASDLTGTVSVTVDSGGGGGGSNTAGTAGGNSTFGSYFTAYGGGGGGSINSSGATPASGGGGGGCSGAGTSGTNSASVTGLGGAPGKTTYSGTVGTDNMGFGGGFGGAPSQEKAGSSYYGGGGGAGSGDNAGTTTIDGGDSYFGGAGGGAGGGLNAGSANHAGDGGNIHAFGTAGGGVHNSGANGSDGAAGDSTKSGTGGGGGASKTSGTGYNGGKGGAIGGGGGGGGGSNPTGGTGGTGGRGEVRVITYF